ncbi:hypothetical protein BDP81DRAFT_424604 [Colletotrichum phormii]|uniref:Uncharacterized protein n=1 Tax=Colletotrichum phormii TaxID=359342 RepID=A0AAJ0EGR8_9PEZI|nr:uncharacterized protein BDP81DRAFT_424604 [Colletotrichum phormii]KAK1638274.1 hypothetical protein BDP81DRAFT_424604 [Colletotrichum phormii]
MGWRRVATEKGRGDKERTDEGGAEKPPRRQGRDGGRVNSPWWPMFVANRDDKRQRHRPLLRQDGGTWKSRAEGEHGRAAKAVGWSSQINQSRAQRVLARRLDESSEKDDGRVSEYAGFQRRQQQ